jgi:type III secretion system low calcium response chaperone LcrH/SycD
VKKNWSPEEQDHLYAVGFGSYSQGSYAQASSLFTTLVTANPFDERFWRGLASSKQMEEKYQEALRAWSLVALLCDKDPLPHFHAAECLMSLNEKSDALKALKMAQELSSTNADLQTKIELLREVNYG